LLEFIVVAILGAIILALLVFLLGNAFIAFVKAKPRTIMGTVAGLLIGSLVGFIFVILVDGIINSLNEAISGAIFLIIAGVLGGFAYGMKRDRQLKYLKPQRLHRIKRTSPTLKQAPHLHTTQHKCPNPKCPIQPHKTPTKTAESSATEAPEVTAEPQVQSATEAPEVTAEPQVQSATEAPEVTAEPQVQSAIEAPKVTAEPQVQSATEAPEVTAELEMEQ
jgi:hypothetical protein